MKDFSNFTFNMPTEIVFGKDTELQTAELIKKYGGTKVMIVMDGGGFIKKSGLFDRVASTLNAAGIPYVELGGVQPNPRLSLIYEGLEQVKREKVDFLLAIGGGSTIDTAKAIGLGTVYDGDLWDFYTRKAKLEKMAPVGSISTIAASGSETSGSTVVMDDINTHMKWGGGCRAVFAIMNPELTYSVPPFMTGVGATDVLAHAFDTYFVYGDSYLGDRFCESTMSTVVKYAPMALKNPSSYEARAELMIAASFAHNGTCRIGRRRMGMGGGHTLEMPVGSVFDTPHGAGLAVLMPALLQYVLDHDEISIPKIAQFAVNVFNVAADPRNLKEVGQEGINRFRAWLKAMGMPATLQDLIGKEMTDAQIDDLVNRVKYGDDGLIRGYGHNAKEDVRNIYLSVR